MIKSEVTNNKPAYIIIGGLVVISCIMGLVLSSSKVLADGDSVTDQIEITVPSACTMVGTVNSAHTTTMSSGTYSGVNGIGKTTLTTRCNDYNGFSVYAIGHSNDTDGNNTLIGTNTGETINTGVYTSGDTTSKWSMKITKVTDTTEAYNPNNMTIQNSFDSWHTVPNDYTKIAEYKASTGSSATDATLGAKIETTYDAYMSAAQAADSYEGKVKYVMVHPYDGSAPEKVVPPTFSWQEPTATKPDDSEINYTFQDFDSTICNLGTTGQIGWLKDSRDGTVYTIGKLADGKCWMLDNLVIDLTNASVLSDLSNDNTNASNAALGYLKGTSSRDPSVDPDGKYATAGVSNNWNGTNSYSAPLIYLGDKDVIPSDSISTEGGYKTGGFYNYCAASAGSYCYGDGTSWGISSGNATEDICSKGWRMPIGNANGEFYWLYYDGGYNDYASYRAALRLPLSGAYFAGSVEDRGQEAYWWTSTRDAYARMYTLIVSTNRIHPDDYNGRQRGHSMRCVLDS